MSLQEVCGASEFDIRMTHPTSPTYMNMEMTNIYKLHEKQKREQYLDRVINVEKASFTPLVFSTTGGMAPECIRTNKRIATLIALKTGEKYCHVVSHIRTRLRFALLRACLIAVRGFRGKSSMSGGESDLSDISSSRSLAPTSSAAAASASSALNSP